MKGPDTMRAETLVLLGISALLGLAGFWVSLEFFSVDEVVYVLGADTFRTTGGFTLDNGFDHFGAESLQWIGFLPVGPNGQTTQYPPGMSVLGGGLVALFGLRGLIFLNIAGTIGSLFVTRALALELFGRERLALMACLLLLLGSFVVEYAFGYWPHMVSVFSVNLSFLLFWRALTRETGRIALAAGSGLALGLGMHFRLDCILLLPVIGLVTLFYATDWRQMRDIAIGGLSGLCAPLAALAAINQSRYGTWNPLSYGRNVAGEGTSLTTYLPLMAGALGLVGLVVVIRLLGPKVRPRVWGGLVVLGAALAALLLPQVQTLILKYAKGVLDLIIDATYIVDSRPGVKIDEDDGLLEFWGLAKKALGQSLPWMGVLLALAGLSWGRDRRSITVLLILIGLWTCPFLLQSWHGGLGSNMRYFLPVLPALALLATWTIARLAEGQDRLDRRLFLGGAAGCLMVYGWIMLAPTGLDGAQQVLSTWVFLAIAASACLAGFVATPALRRVALALTAVGLGVSGFNGLTDTTISQMRRDNSMAAADLAQKIEGPALIYIYLYRSALLNPDQYISITLPKTDEDFAMINRALDEGWRVIIPTFFARDLVALYPEYTFEEVAGTFPDLASITYAEPR